MNINAVRLVLVGTKTISIVMCKILMVVVMFFGCAHINSTFLGHDSLPLVLISILTYIHITAYVYLESWSVFTYVILMYNNNNDTYLQYTCS